MAGVLNDLGATILPGVFGALNTAGVVDTMTVQGETLSTDSGGGLRKATPTTVYSSVPVTYRPNVNNFRGETGGRIQSQNEYILKFPLCNTSGSRYTVDPKAHRLVIDARGVEPAKTFRIISLADNGVIYEAICIKEN